MPRGVCKTCDGFGTVLLDLWWGCGDPECCGTCPEVPCPDCSDEDKRTDFTSEDWT